MYAWLSRIYRCSEKSDPTQPVLPSVDTSCTPQPGL